MAILLMFVVCFFIIAAYSFYRMVLVKEHLKEINDFLREKEREQESYLSKVNRIRKDVHELTNTSFISPSVASQLLSGKIPKDETPKT